MFARCLPILPDTVAAVHRVKQQIDMLPQEQAKALKSATSIGMTPDEAKEYDERRTRITKLIHELELLEKAQ
jgi:hypothetical protein